MTQTRRSNAHLPETGKSQRGNLLRAVAYVNGGVLLFSLMGVVIRFASDYFDTLQIAMIRNISGTLVICLLFANQLGWRVRRQDVIIRQWPLAVFRGSWVVLAQVCYFLALTRIELATVQSLGYTTPLIVTALSVVILGDRVGIWRWSAVAIGFTGVILVIKPYDSSFSWVLLLPVLAACGYGSSLVTMRLFDDNVPTLLINAYGTACATLISVLIVIGFSTTGWDAPPIAWAMALGLGLLGGVGVYLITAGYREVTPSQVAPFDYFGLIYALVLGWLVFAEAPFDRLIPGVFLIVGAGGLILWRERKRGVG